MIQLEFQCNPNVYYEATLGASFTDERSETLDSGQVIVPHVYTRIPGLAPYQYVLVKGLVDGNRLMLVDNFVEKLVNVATGMYQYTISLMSETKLLEKWQLPNRSFTHVIGEEPLSLYQEIIRIASCIPQVYTASGTYRPFISYDVTALQAKFGSTPAKDISLSQPTMREALTALMSQIGCIPRVINGVLTYLDLRETPVAWGDVAGLNYTERSMSSDSFVTQLVNLGDNILDTSNNVLHETIGFRDTGNALLKQQSNLFLNTRYPIYNVSKMVLHAYVRVSMTFSNIRPSIYQGNVIISLSGTTLTIQIDPDGKTLTGIHVYTFTASGYGYAYQIIATPSDISTITTLTYTVPINAEAGISFGFQGYDVTAFFSSWINSAPVKDFYTYFSADLSSLCVEQGKRSLLNTDFVAMSTSVSSTGQLAQYYEGTVGYTIGDTKITGFSSTYSYTPSGAWWSVEKTYIENIMDNLIGFLGTSGYKAFADWDTIFSLFGIPNENNILSLYSENVGVLYTSIARQPSGFANNFYSPASTPNYTNLFFDIEYQPLNSLAIKYDKTEDVADFPIQQLDMKQNGISCFDDLSNAETDKANRLGNSITSINQRVNSASDIQALNTLYDGTDTVFKRTISYRLNYFDINYYASKDYIIRNYSTAIQTKYRASQYIDYGQSIVRKENIKIYAYLSKTQYTGRNTLVSFGNNAGSYLFAGLTGDTCNSIRYAYETISGTSMKSEVSVCTYGSDILLSFQDFDNVSPGIYITPGKYQEAIGLPQSWYIWETYTGRKFGFVDNISYVVNGIWNIVTSEIDTYYQNIWQEPLIKTGMVSSTAVSVDFNPPEWYKDGAEVLNTTAQFELLSDEVEWTSMLARLSPLVGRDQEYVWYVIYPTSAPALQEGERSEPAETVYPVSGRVTLNVALGIVTVSRDNTQILVSYGGKWFDVAYFPTAGTYYISFSNTKSLKRWTSTIDGLPYTML